MRVRAILRLKNHKVLERREALGMTQKEYAEHVGIMLQVLQEIECLRQYTPRITPRTIATFQIYVLKVAADIDCDAQEIWPDWMFHVNVPSKIEKVADVTHDQIAATAAVKGLPSPQQNPYTLIESEEVRETLLKSIKELPFRSREIIRHRLGLAGRRIHTLRETAKEFGCSYERVRSLQSKAELRLKKVMKGKYPDLFRVDI